LTRKNSWRCAANAVNATGSARAAVREDMGSGDPVPADSLNSLEREGSQLVPAMRDKEIRYEVVFEDEWKKRLNELLAE